MIAQIRIGGEQDVEALVQLSLLAWEPVFESFRHTFGPAVYATLYPDWHQLQRTTVESFCKPHENTVFWIAEVERQVAGFLICDMNPENKIGEVKLLAVHPDYQNHGIGAELNQVALAEMKVRGMKLAVVATGGDPSHAPARRCYEKSGYTPFPQVWYYQALP